MTSPPHRMQGLLTLTSEPYCFAGGAFHPVETGTPETLEQHTDRTLFLCWPPYASDMAALCLQHYHGDRLVYIGEGEGGCNADDTFFEMLEDGWHEVAHHRPIQWDAIHDWVYVYERGAEQQ